MSETEQRTYKWPHLCGWISAFIYGWKIVNEDISNLSQKFMNFWSETWQEMTSCQLEVPHFGGTMSGNFSSYQKGWAESKVVQHGILAFHKYKCASWIVSFACQIHRENGRQDWDNSMLWPQLLSTCFNIFISMRYGNIWVEMNIHKI